MSTGLTRERAHLAELLEAVQRSSWFLHESAKKINWPLDAELLAKRNKDVDFFETLSAINERFAKLQDTLASTMRHSALLLGEPTDPFLKVLAFFEKQGVLDSVEAWQECRMVRNMAAHDYDTDYELIAEHFNVVHSLVPMLLSVAKNLLELVARELLVHPASTEFESEFKAISM